MQNWQNKKMMRVLAVGGMGLLLGWNANLARADGDPTWMLRSDAPTDPPDMHWPAVAFDSGNNVTVLFGGHREGSDPLYDGTWTWDGTAWTEKLGLDPRPSRRDACTMAYDSARGVCVIFGGHGLGSGNVLGDTWEWDGSAWTQKCPCDPQPSPRAFHALAYDSLRGVVVLFGGWDASNRLNDTWEWNGATWTDVTPEPPALSPSPRQEVDMAYDADRGVVVLFGGTNNGYPSGADNETWEWDGATWTDVTPEPPAINPPARQAFGLAFDSVRHVTVLFGGRVSSGYLDDTWEWDGATWTPVPPEPPAISPPARQAFDMAYDSARQAIVLFGGHTGEASNYLGDTWEYALDCNGNDTPDAQDLADCDGSAWCDDCNGNGVPDGCEPDCDGDGTIDDCDDDIDGDGVLNGADVCPRTPSCQVLMDGRPRLDLHEDCDVNGLDIQVVVQQLLAGCSECD